MLAVLRGPRYAWLMAQRCSCEITLALLALFGGPHAARMRRLGTTRVGEWGEQDWLDHMQEEETLFFSMLPAKVRGALESDHAVIREYFRTHGPRARVPDELALDHAELEDLWAEHLGKIHGWNLHDH